MRGGFGGLGTISRARRRQSIITGDDGSSHRRFSSATSAGVGRRDTVMSADANLAGRGVRRFQLHDPPPSPRAPPSSYHPDGLLGRKRRDSHDSAAAVQGSVHGDQARTANGNGDASSPVDEKGDTTTPVTNGIDDGMTENGDLPIGLLLAQQHWAERRSSTALDTASQAPTITPGTKHTQVQFVEPASVVAHRQRERGEVPPISFTPPVLSPNSSSYSLLNPSATGFGRQALDANGGMIASPLSITPLRTPDEEADAESRPPMFPTSSNPRGVASIVHHMLESTEEVAEPPEDVEEQKRASKSTDSKRAPRPSTPSAAANFTAVTDVASSPPSAPASAKNSRAASLRARSRSPPPVSEVHSRPQSPNLNSRPPSRAHSPLPLARPTSPQPVPVRSRTPTAGSAASSSPGKRSNGTGRSDGAALIRPRTRGSEDGDDGPDEY